MSSAAALYNQNAVSRSLNSYWSTRNRLHHLVRKCFSLFALLYLGRDGTCMTCSVAITDHSHHNSHHRLVDRWKNKKNGSINALTTIRRSWAGAAPPGQKMNGNCPFTLCSLPTPFFSSGWETRQMHTHVNMFHIDIRLLTTRQHVIYFFFTISSICSLSCRWSWWDNDFHLIFSGILPYPKSTLDFD